MVRATWEENFFSVGPTFFRTPPPPRGGHPRKKISHPVSKIFFFPPPGVFQKDCFATQEVGKEVCVWGGFRFSPPKEGIEASTIGTGRKSMSMVAPVPPTKTNFFASTYVPQNDQHSVAITRGALLVGTRPQREGGGTPPPSTDPKIVVRNNVLCWRQRRRRFCFRHRAGGNFFVRPYVSVLKILRISWRIQKWLKSTKKDFDPNPASRSDLG